MGAALLAAAPILTVLVAMAGLRLSAAVSGALGLATAAAVVALAFPAPAGSGVGRFALGVAAEAGHATLSILWIILPALTLYEYQSRSGGLARMRDALAGLTGDRRLQALLIAWFFGLFMEGAAGFGAPVALAAPLLVGLGFAPVTAVALALLGHALGVTFGAVGAPPLAQIEIAGLPPVALAAATATVAALPGLVMLAAVTRLAGPGFGGWRAAGWAGLAGLCFLAPYGLVAATAGPELPTLTGALVGFGLFLGALRLAGAAGPARAEGLARDLLPYAALVAVVLLTRLIPPAAEAVGGVVIAWTLFDVYGARVAPLAHPGTAIALCVILAALATGRGGVAAQALGAALRRLAPVALALLVMLLLSRLMVRGGLVEALARGAAGAGAGWPWIAPWVGALGTFVTGSATASSVLFTQLQISTAQQLGLSQTAMAAAQGAGGAIGNVIAPHNIIAGCATVGLARRESDILRHTAGPAALALLAAGAVAAALAA
jgi:lactate permease